MKATIIRKILGGRLHESGLFYEGKDGKTLFLEERPNGVVRYFCYSEMPRLSIRQFGIVTKLAENEVLEVVTFSENEENVKERRFFRSVEIGYGKGKHVLVEVSAKQLAE